MSLPTELRSLPFDVGIDEAYASTTPTMRPSVDKSFDSALANTSDVVSVGEFGTRVMDSAERTIATPHEPFVDRQVTPDLALLSPFDNRVQTLYDAYHTSYVLPIDETSEHMLHAKNLALALLQRHYPESRGYFVEPATIGTYAAKGVNFLLKQDGESDSDPDDPPIKHQKRAFRTNNTHFSYRAPWHFIAPENIISFVVKKLVPEVREDVEVMAYRTHTSLVIILDNLSTFQRWSRDNVNHRGDVLSDSLGVLGKIKQGHGMLFFGPRLELYAYDADNVSHPVQPSPIQEWRMDMRTTSLADVDEALRVFAEQEVFYEDGYASNS